MVSLTGNLATRTAEEKKLQDSFVHKRKFRTILDLETDVEHLTTGTIVVIPAMLLRCIRTEHPHRAQTKVVTTKGNDCYGEDQVMHRRTARAQLG
mgnify:CR=1 FL=1